LAEKGTGRRTNRLGPIVAAKKKKLEKKKEGKVGGKNLAARKTPEYLNRNKEGGGAHNRRAKKEF